MCQSLELEAINRSHFARAPYVSQRMRRRQPRAAGCEHGKHFTRSEKTILGILGLRSLAVACGGLRGPFLVWGAVLCGEVRWGAVGYGVRCGAVGCGGVQCRPHLVRGYLLWQGCRWRRPRVYVQSKCCAARAASPARRRLRMGRSYGLGYARPCAGTTTVPASRTGRSRRGRRAAARARLGT